MVTLYPIMKSRLLLCQDYGFIGSPQELYRYTSYSSPSSSCSNSLSCSVHRQESNIITEVIIQINIKLIDWWLAIHRRNKGQIGTLGDLKKADRVEWHSRVESGSSDTPFGRTIDMHSSIPSSWTTLDVFSKSMARISPEATWWLDVRISVT